MYFNCCWREYIKPLRFHCLRLPISTHLMHHFAYSVLWLDCPECFAMLRIAAKYDIDGIHYSTVTMKNAVRLELLCK